MSGYQAGRDCHRINCGKPSLSAKASHNGKSRLMNITAINRSVRERRGYRHWAIEKISVRCTKHRDRQPCLREARGKLRMSVHDGTDLLELAIQQRMGIEVGRWFQRSFDHCSVKVGDYHMLWPKLIVTDT